MKIAILSDIHGNIEALNEVLKHTQSKGCEQYIILGDFVGYYYQPKAVLDAVRKLPNVVAIKGNHEDLLFKSMNDCQFASICHRKYGSGINIAMQELTQGDLDWLSGLPESKSLILDGKKIGVFHGSDVKTDEYIYPNVKLSRLEQIDDSYDYVLTGHTHYPVIFLCDGAVVINPGSVGQPRDVGSLACYATLDTENGAVQHHRVPFDSESLRVITEKTDPHYPYLSEILTRNNIHVRCK